MARIADKHGLTNKYRPIGSGKRVVKRGRPRKYLFGPPSRKRKTYKSSPYRSSSYKGTNNYANMDIDTSGCISIALIPFFVILLIMFSLIPIFRCLIPIIVGAGLLFVVEEYCKKSWGLPTGRWSKPVSIGWTILTAFAMVVGFVLVLLVQVAEIPAIVIFIFAFVYAGLSVLILRKKYNKVKTHAGIKQTPSTTPISSTKTTADIKTELSQKKEKWINGGKEKLQQWRESNGFAQQKENKERAEQLHKIVMAPFEELKEEQIKPFGETVTLAEFHQVQAAGYFRVIRESLELLNKTTNPSTFFGRYETAIDNAKRVIELMKQYDASDEAEELLESLLDEKESLVDEFIDRCYNEGVLQQLKEKILRHSSELTSGNIQYMEDLLNGELDETDFDDEETVVREACSKLKKNLRIDMAFWDEMHLDFRCNLVTSYDQLQLNYEIKNTSGVPWYCGSGGIEIKANVYNAGGDLLCVEDDYIDDDEIAKNRYSAYILFHLDDVKEAAYIEVFAHQDM